MGIKMRGIFKKNLMDCRTAVFLTFLILFFGSAGYLTYYAGVVYLRNLPVVETVMPEHTGEIRNGRYTYLVPQDAIHVDQMGKRYVLTARYQKDILGERSLAKRIDVWILEKRDNGMVLVEGIVREEPVLTGTGDTILADQAIAVAADE